MSELPRYEATKYIPGRDYCGPENKPCLAAFVPDKIKGIDLSRCCWRHDNDYANGGPKGNHTGDEKGRKAADDNFIACICENIEKGDFGWWRTFLYKWIARGTYYRTVRKSGGSYFVYRIKNDD